METFLLLKGGGKYILEMKVGVTSVKVVIKYFGPSPFYRNMFTGEALRNFQRVGKKDSTRITRYSPTISSSLKYPGQEMLG